MTLSARALLLTLLAPALLSAINPDLLQKAWPARWITVPGAPPHDYGVYHFRRAFELPAKPAAFVVHVTGDNRYQLFANGQRVSEGPARADLYHWRYETVDLAPYLRPGKNVLAAVVWNEGPDASLAQNTNQTGFLLQGDTAAERIVDTGASWLCIEDKSYTPHPIPNTQKTGYHALGPAEQVNGALYPWGWETLGFNDSAWVPALPITPGAPRDAQDAPNRWMLVPRPIPAMAQTPEPPLRIREAEGIPTPQSLSALTIPARTRVRFILDQTHLTTAYPELVLSGGRGATVALKYAEGLWEPQPRESFKGSRWKGDRDQIAGKLFLGYQDIYATDGGPHRLFRPLYWRTYRYIELTAQTGDAPLTIENLHGVFTGYPFERKAQFQSNSAELPTILDVGWRTARLCAHETYMDCPYYEQLQYVGDTRIQALVTLYTTGDTRLVRNAISQINDSRTAEGATYSRAPSRLQQYIPGFSLWWIGMVHDYWRYADDPAFVRDMLPGVRAVLSFFARYQDANGSLMNVPWWNYVDWTKEWKSGVPPMSNGHSALFDLQLLLAYQWAADLETAQGLAPLAELDRAAAQRLRTTIRTQYWDASRGLFSDTPAHDHFSQQTNTLAVLAHVAEPAEAKPVMTKVLNDHSLVQASIYFLAYVNAALRESGLGDQYLAQLGQWREMLNLHLTTWAESLAFDRSDCHAWGASPNYELFRTVLGIDSAAPGFRRVRIAPHLNGLAQLSGSIPHPAGTIQTTYAIRNGKLIADISLPQGIQGEFVWAGRTRALTQPSSHLELPASAAK